MSTPIIKTNDVSSDNAFVQVENELVNRAWSLFRDRGTWLGRRPLFVELDDRGIDLNTFLEQSKHLYSRDEGNDCRSVAVRFETLLALPECQKLLEPLPAVLRLAAQRYIASPSDMDDVSAHTRLTMSEVAFHWPSRAEAALAIRLLKYGNGPLHWSSRSGEDDYTFELDVRYLCYEHVSSLAEALAVDRSLQGPTVNGPLEGPYLALVRAAFGEAVCNGRWPAALTFAVDHRDIGFVPRLMASLHERYVRNGFRESGTARVRLSANVVPYLGLDEEQMRLFLAVVRAFSQVYRRLDGRRAITSTDIATELGLPLRTVLPCCLLLEDEPWTDGGSPGFEVVEWSTYVNEKVLRFKKVASWDEYLAICREQFRSPWDGDLADDTSDDEPFDEPSSGRPPPAMMNVPMLSTFISYGAPDTVVARRLYEALTAKGVETFFFPEHAPPGLRLSQVMADGVNQYDRVLLICSEQALSRSGVLNELEEALSREARTSGDTCIIPLTLDDYVFSGWQPKQPRIARALRDRVIADFRKAVTDQIEFDRALGRILQVLRKS